MTPSGPQRQALTRARSVTSLSPHMRPCSRWGISFEGVGASSSQLTMCERGFRQVMMGPTPTSVQDSDAITVRIPNKAGEDMGCKPEGSLRRRLWICNRAEDVANCLERCGRRVDSTDIPSSRRRGRHLHPRLACRRRYPCINQTREGPGPGELSPRWHSGNDSLQRTVPYDIHTKGYATSWACHHFRRAMSSPIQWTSRHGSGRAGMIARGAGHRAWWRRGDAGGGGIFMSSWTRSRSQAATISTPHLGYGDRRSPSFDVGTWADYGTAQRIGVTAERPPTERTPATPRTDRHPSAPPSIETGLSDGGGSRPSLFPHLRRGGHQIPPLSAAAALAACAV